MALSLLNYIHLHAPYLQIVQLRLERDAAREEIETLRGDIADLNHGMQSLQESLRLMEERNADLVRQHTWRMVVAHTAELTADGALWARGHGRRWLVGVCPHPPSSQ